MHNETVRRDPLSPSLTLQLLLGNAIEALLLLEVGTPLDQADEATILAVADALVANEPEGDEAFRQAALPSEDPDILNAARAALDPADMVALERELGELSSSLRQLTAIQSSAMPLEAVVERLDALREALASRSLTKPDEVLGILSDR